MADFARGCTEQKRAVKTTLTRGNCTDHLRDSTRNSALDCGECSEDDEIQMKDNFDNNLERYRIVAASSEYRYLQSIYTKCFWFAVLAIIGLLAGGVRLLFSVQKGLWLAGICVVLLFLAAIGMAIAQSNRREILKRNAVEDPFSPAPTDTTAIQWCKNCSRFRPQKGWDSRSNNGPWQGLIKPDIGKLPCAIADQVRSVWDNYFAESPEKRTLFPKTCERFERRR